jgi:hypothetical protein
MHREVAEEMQKRYLMAFLRQRGMGSSTLRRGELDSNQSGCQEDPDGSV